METLVHSTLKAQTATPWRDATRQKAAALKFPLLRIKSGNQQNVGCDTTVPEENTANRS
jgi:hypothetical protein